MHLSCEDASSMHALQSYIYKLLNSLSRSNLKKLFLYLPVIVWMRRKNMLFCDRLLSLFVFKIRIVWPAKQSEQVGDFIFWSRDTVVI